MLAVVYSKMFTKVCAVPVDPLVAVTVSVALNNPDRGVGMRGRRSGGGSTVAEVPGVGRDRAALETQRSPTIKETFTGATPPRGSPTSERTGRPGKPISPLAGVTGPTRTASAAVRTRASAEHPVNAVWESVPSHDSNLGGSALAGNRTLVLEPG